MALSHESNVRNVRFDLASARRMLPLVRRIVDDLASDRKRLGVVAMRCELLEESKRSLDWSSRSQHYELKEESTRLENRLSSARAELDGLGVVLVDELAGAVDFPTKIHGKTAYFSWQLGDESLNHWHRANEPRRPIPTDWDSRVMSLASQR